MTDCEDNPQWTGHCAKEEHADFIDELKDRGLSRQTAIRLIEDEEISSMEGLKHLRSETIMGLKIPQGQKDILRQMVRKLNPSNVAIQGGIQTSNCTMKVGRVDGTATLASVRGVGEGAGIQMEDVKMEAESIGKHGVFTTIQVDKGGNAARAVSVRSTDIVTDGKK